MFFKQFLFPVIIFGIDGNLFIYVFMNEFLLSRLNLYYYFFAVVYVFAEESELREVIADRGTNVTLSCGVLQDPKFLNTPVISFIQWVHRGNRTHHEILVRYKYLSQ